MILIERLLEGLQVSFIINSSDKSSNNVAFMIEGLEFALDHVENISAVNLAKYNSSTIFDIISSFDSLVFKEAYKEADELNQKLIVLITILLFKERGIEFSIKEIIRKPYRLLVKQQILPKLPCWLKNLRKDNYPQFMATFFKMSRKKLPGFSWEEASNRTIKKLVDISNAVSAINLECYLKTYSQIDIIWELWALLT